MSTYLNGKQIGVSAEELNAQLEIIKNQFQDKRITWNGTDNVLLTTALTELQQTASGKANIVVADELPQTTVANTQYWVKTYDGHTLDNGRYILITDSLNVVNYVGTSDVDLSNYYTKVESDEKYQTLENKTTSISSSSTDTQYPSAKATYTELDKKQDKLTDDTAYGSNPSNSDTLANTDLSTKKVKKITFSNLWTWILTKITGICEKGIQISSGKLGHSNSITAQTNGIYYCNLDAQGHITGTPTKFSYSNVYNSSATNTLFTRQGAYNMYTYFKSTSTNLTMTLSATNQINIGSNASKKYAVGNLNIINIDIRFLTTTSFSASTAYLTMACSFTGTVKDELKKVSNADWNHIPLTAINESGSYPVDGVDFYNLSNSGANIRISARNGLGNGNAIRVQGTFCYLS